MLGNEIQIANSATVESHELILLHFGVTSRAIVSVGVYLAPKWLTAGCYVCIYLLLGSLPNTRSKLGVPIRGPVLRRVLGLPGGGGAALIG